MNPEFETLSTLCEDERFETLRARRTRTGALVLLKRSRRGVRASVLSAALQRECALAGSLSSGATLLPRLIDSDGATLLAMEDPGGELLSARLRSGAIEIDSALKIGARIAALLGELHARALLHNGIRPDAILCAAPGADTTGNASAWLIDLGQVASASLQNSAASEFAGTASRLVYMSPEQTGRMDRAPDARSDLYGLGLVMYEMLTGAPPLRSDDALEQIHWHIAGIPREPMHCNSAIAPVLSDIVMKLLAKSPEERYQSADGLRRDLEHCAHEWAAHRAIATIPLGRRDRGARLVISPRLYGREPEVRILVDSFDRACQGRAGGSLLLVQGYAGIGKTSLIQQLVRPIIRQKGYFISGKFDQVVRGVPFGALIKAFRALVRQLLTESEQRLVVWRESLSTALGSNGGVLAEVIPEIEFIVGPQPQPAVLGSTEAQNRFQRVLQQFLAVLAQPEHPLVLFLDDLQWADASTLALLEPLLASTEIRCLMLMGAYRDNELDAAPRLTRALAALNVAGARVTRVSLGALRLPDLVALVADTLHSTPDDAAALAQLVLAKTGGNPFFVIQFLKMLERDGHLRFDDDAARWIYRIDELADAPLADNVIDLMTRSIRRLPAKAQYALTLAACIGNRFDRPTLSIVSEQSPAATNEDIELALAEGLIVPAVAPFNEAVDAADETSATFAFLHDRVQQSAYALIPAERRQMVHLTVGRLLHARAAPSTAGAKDASAGLFDIVHHMNRGRGLIHGAAERREVAELNLTVGRRAKSSTAHDTALDLFRCGIELLDTPSDADDERLAFELKLEAAESQYLCGQFDAALQAFDALVGEARGAIDRARVVRLRSVQYENMARYDDSLTSAREGLALFGVSFPKDPAEKAIALEREIAAIDAAIGAHPIAALIELPVMSDPSIRMVMTMLTDIWSAAYILGDPILARLISATMVRLSLEHGNVEESAYGYVTHAITVGPVRGQYQAAYEFGCLALEVNRRFDDSRRRAKIYQQFHAHVNLWCRPLHTCMAYAREACRSGLDSGDFLYAAYGAGTEPWSAIVCTQDLGQFVADYTPSVTLIEKLKATGFADSTRLIICWARALQDRTDAPLSLTDASFDEAAYLRAYSDNPFFATIHAVARLQICALLATPRQALLAALHSAALVHHVPGTVWPVIHDFWHALVLAANLHDASVDDRSAWLVQIEAARAGFDTMAQHCAENFRCQALLLAAELARANERDAEAARCYEEAIEFAAGAPLVQYHALAHELYARFRAARGQTHLAAMHFAQARERYAKWGAYAKVRQLERQAPTPADGSEGSRPAQSPRSETVPEAIASSVAATDVDRLDGANGLDLFSVLKAAQAITAEVELPLLLARLMHIAVENAGAERGALVLESAAGPVVFATDPIAAADFIDSTGASVRTLPRDAGFGVALDSCSDVPAGIVNYVRRTGESVVLSLAETDEEYGVDPYVLQHRPRSVACVPVRKQGASIGVLYLENRRVGAVFTPQRLRTLRILAAQAAISVENARLFAGLKQEIAEREQTQSRLGAALAEVERLKDGLEAENSYLRRDLIANVSHDLRTPLVSMRGYLEVLLAKGDALAADQRAQYLGVAVRQSERLGRLIDELFELAKLDFKGVSLMREPFPFGELAVDVVQKFRLIAQGKRVALNVDAASGLPMVDADLGLMERVLENLIGNALQHTPDGGTVSVRLRAQSDCLIVQVTDSGAGIAASELPLVFDRFYRGANGRQRANGGAGLGLAITKRIMELHGNEIGVESSSGQGTCFTLRLACAAT